MKGLQEFRVPFSCRYVLSAVAGCICKHIIQLVFTFNIDTSNPVQVVEAHKFGIYAVCCYIIFGRDLLDQADRCVAQANTFNLRIFQNGFGDHPSRVSEIEQPCVGSQFLDITAYIQNNRDGAQCFHHSPRTCCFLANNAIFERNRLITGTGIKHADTHLGADEVGAFDSFTAVCCQMNLNRKAGFLHHTFCQVTYNIQLAKTRLNIYKP
ncbi:hypothetical protein D3C75_538350 [compost metagenome]